MVAHVLTRLRSAVVVNGRPYGRRFRRQGIADERLLPASAALAAEAMGCGQACAPTATISMITASATISSSTMRWALTTAAGSTRSAAILARCGYAADHIRPVTDRALFHADNAYYYPAVPNCAATR